MRFAVAFSFVVDQRFAIHDELDVFFGLRGWMTIEKSARFSTFKIDHDDCTFGGFRDERSVGARVDANVVEITFLRRHIFTEWDLFVRPGSLRGQSSPALVRP
jgi:hypothetical protein